jgi:arylsulfatase A-like enzyme
VQQRRQPDISATFRRKSAALLALALATVVHTSMAQAVPAARKRVLLILIDGLRPDQITDTTVPRLFDLSRHSVSFQNHHSVFPTVTRVNASTISTGVYPEKHGIFSNLLYMPSFSSQPLSTGESKNLILRASLNGDRILRYPTLSEVMTAAGQRFVAITSGSSGAATLLAPEARHGTGTLVNAGLEEGKRVAYPNAIDSTIRERFGVQPAHEGLSSVLWAQKVLREYLIPDLSADLLIDWMTEPDTAQHRYGVGSPQALDALHAVDEELGHLLDLLRSRGELASTDILITSDHGFGDVTASVDLAESYRAAGLADDEVTSLRDGPTTSFYLHPHHRAEFRTALKALTESLERRSDVALLFTSSRPDGRCRAGATYGVIPGTFALEKVHLCGEGGPALVVSMQASDSANRFGQPGTVSVLHGPGEAAESAATHGGLNPWMEHIPLVCTGPDFATSRLIAQPTGNIDITATIASLLHLQMQGLQGRDLSNDPRQGRAPGNQIVRQYSTRRFGIRRTLKMTAVGNEEYPDSGSVQKSQISIQNKLSRSSQSQADSVHSH